VTVQTLTSDAVIWATILLVVVGVAAGLTIAMVSVLGRLGRSSPADARATSLRILRIAAVVYVAAFLGGLIVGWFQSA
jgi:ABC-type amino acid transport system permease subunit